MNAIRATWRDGQIVPDDPVNWPEGRKLLILEAAPAGIDFMTEEEQRDDPAAIERWIEDLQAIPPLPMSPAEEAELLAWRQKVKEFNLEAVRRQMAEDVP